MRQQASCQKREFFSYTWMDSSGARRDFPSLRIDNPQNSAAAETAPAATGTKSEVGNANDCRIFAVTLEGRHHTMKTTQAESSRALGVEASGAQSQTAAGEGQEYETTARQHLPRSLSPGSGSSCCHFAQSQSRDAASSDQPSNSISGNRQSRCAAACGRTGGGLGASCGSSSVEKNPGHQGRCDRPSGFSEDSESAKAVKEEAAKCASRDRESESDCCCSFCVLGNNFTIENPEDSEQNNCGPTEFPGLQKCQDGKCCDHEAKPQRLQGKLDSGADIAQSSAKSTVASSVSSNMATIDVSVCDNHQRSLVRSDLDKLDKLDVSLTPDQESTSLKPKSGQSLHSRSLPTMRRLHLPQILTPSTDGEAGNVSEGVFPSLEPGNGSTKSSPLSFRSCSPTSWSVTSASPLQSPQKHIRQEIMSTRSLEALLAAANGGNSKLRLARDPIQPHSGSISDIHVEVSADEEETDVFDLAPMQRPRSRTWSENRAWQRKRIARAKAMTRPPTPPPGGIDKFFTDLKLQTAVSKEKLKIPDRELPELPESSS